MTKQQYFLKDALWWLAKFTWTKEFPFFLFFLYVYLFCLSVSDMILYSADVTGWQKKT
ncbi:hypothetical protein L873DRAFT_1800310, partial [Choiromyces venosus 120613-1]